jgi:hypothetical protein
MFVDHVSIFDRPRNPWASALADVDLLEGHAWVGAAGANGRGVAFRNCG